MIGKMLFELLWGQIVGYRYTPINREEQPWAYWIGILMQAALTTTYAFWLMRACSSTVFATKFPDLGEFLAVKANAESKVIWQC